MGDTEIMIKELNKYGVRNNIVLIIKLLFGVMCCGFTIFLLWKDGIMNVQEYKPSLIMAGFSAIVWIPCIIGICIAMFSLIFGGYKKKYREALARSMDISLEDIEREYFEARKYSPKLRISKHFTWYTGFFTPLMIRNTDIIWVYKHVETTTYTAYHIINYWKTKREYLYLVDRAGEEYGIKLHGDNIRVTMEHYFYDHKHIVNGYSEDIARQVKHNREQVVRMIDEKLKVRPVFVTPIVGTEVEEENTTISKGGSMFSLRQD